MGVALAAGTALPLADWLGGWRAALAVPAFLTAATVVAWEILSGRRVMLGWSAVLNDDLRASGPSVTSTGWRVTVYAATPMLIGFTALAWTAPMYVEQGLGPARAAALFVFFQLAQFVRMLSLPAVLDRRDDKRPVLVLPLALILAGLGGMMLPSAMPPELAVTLLGLGVGGATALGLALVSAMSATHVDAGRLGSMVFTVGFGLSTIGPRALGRSRTPQAAFSSAWHASRSGV